MSKHKHFYAAHSYMGVNFTYDSPCWSLYAFDSAKERDEWVSDHKYNDQGSIVAEAVTSTTARKISTWLNKCTPHDNQTGYYTFNNGREVTHL